MKQKTNRIIYLIDFKRINKNIDNILVILHCTHEAMWVYIEPADRSDKMKNQVYVKSPENSSYLARLGANGKT